MILSTRCFALHGLPAPSPLTRACLTKKCYNKSRNGISAQMPKPPVFVKALRATTTHTVSFGRIFRTAQHPSSILSRILCAGTAGAGRTSSVLHVARNALFGMGGMEGTLGLT